MYSWLNWNLEVCFFGGRKTLRARTKTNNKLNPHMISSSGIEPGSHWWEATALTTVLTLLPCHNNCDKCMHAHDHNVYQFCLIKARSSLNILLSLIALELDYNPATIGLSSYLPPPVPLLPPIVEKKIMRLPQGFYGTREYGQKLFGNMGTKGK